MPDITITVSDQELATLQTQGTDLSGIAVAALRSTVLPMWAKVVAPDTDAILVSNFHNASADVQDMVMKLLTPAKGGA